MGETIVHDRASLKAALARSMHVSADGCGLKTSSAVPSVHSWVVDETNLMFGAGYIHAIQICGGTVATRKRAARSL